MDPWPTETTTEAQNSDKSFEDDFKPPTDKLPDSEEYLGKLGEQFKIYRVVHCYCCANTRVVR